MMEIVKQPILLPSLNNIDLYIPMPALPPTSMSPTSTPAQLPFKVVACLGISWWKKRRIRSFFQTSPSPRVSFFISARRALRHAHHHDGALAVWASKLSPQLKAQAQRLNVPLISVEDGFIRSLGLGSGFLPPCSIVADTQGAYVDPSQPSDLEALLSNYDVSPALRERTCHVTTLLKQLHISKYAAGPAPSTISSLPRHHPIILVPGQVGGDLSVIRGGGKITNNLCLLKDVRHRNPTAWIIYRPHPDVEAGHRPGALPDSTIKHYANEIHRDGSMSLLLQEIDEVHTLTSLTGFEALLRGKKVVTYGSPFYAGWGLTTHLGPPLPRRNRARDIIDLAAITLIVYPLYVNPATEQRCSLEELITCFQNNELWKPTLAMKIRQQQGRLRRFLTRYF